MVLMVVRKLSFLTRLSYFGLTDKVASYIRQISAKYAHYLLYMDFIVNVLYIAHIGKNQEVYECIIWSLTGFYYLVMFDKK